MSATQTPTEHDQPDILRCTRCNTVLPQYATFCGRCGERIIKQKQEPSSLHYGDIAERYRITSLVRRRPYTQLFFAFDNQQQHDVAINAINLHTLEEAKRTKAIEAFQHQYNLLQRQSMPTTMQLIDLRYFQEHLYVIGTWPKREPLPQARHRQLSTLFTLLQSGIGLPDRQVAIAWIYRLSRTLERLHKNTIVLGDIDPDSILVNDTNFESDPALMVSWLPELLPHPSIHTNAAYFYAPETLIGDIEPRSDIYSLGAILYLLLSGSIPKNATERTQQPIASLHEINPRITSTIDAVVMRALALEKTERYQNANEFSEALLQLSTNPDDLHSAQKNPVQPIQSDKTQRNKEEIHISSQVADNTIDKTEAKQPTATAEEATISVAPLQAQMARRYLSKIKTGKTETQGKQSGEESVEEGLTKEKTSGENRAADATTQTQNGKAATEKLPSGEDREKTSLGDNSVGLIKTGLAEKQDEPPIDLYRQFEHVNSQQTLRSGPLAQEEVAEKQDEPPIDLYGQFEHIQDRQTLDLGPFVKEKNEVHNADEADEAVQDIELQDTILFKYEESKVEDVHEEIKDQSGRGGLEKTNALVRQTQGMVSLPNQTIPGKEPISERLKALLLKTVSTLPGLIWPREVNPTDRTISQQLVPHKESLLLKQIQHFLVGEPHNSTKAAALIETPLRIQPNQNYSIRINVIGRNKPKGNYAAGLSALVQGEKVHIEVRSALYQNYAYIVQQADIQLPGEGYVAEVTMPMQPLSGGPSGRRERLHIFFMDEANNPLYEKPFAIELFISHLVQSGREGHNVLSIPL